MSGRARVLDGQPRPCLSLSPEKLGLATTPGRPVQRRNSWSLLRCTYMVVTFLFVSYNKGDWVRRVHCPRGCRGWVGWGERSAGVTSVP